MTDPGDAASAPSAEGVADHMWRRVRTLAARVDRLQEADGLDELDDDGRALLDRTRVRLARAVERARLADGLADQLAETRRRR